MPTMQYAKTKSRATMKGEWYEVKVAALLYLRSKNSARVAHFQLATNVEGAGALDDIVHRFTCTQDPESWHTTFIQLKHKERAVLGLNSFTGQKGDFSLVKYLDSFTEIRKAKQDNACKNRLFYDGGFDNFQFVIYTNSKVHPDSFASNPIKCGYLEEILKSDSENELIFKFNREKNEGVFAVLEAPEETRADASEFLDKLTVFSGQPAESDLDDIIKKELLVACGGKVSDAGPVYRVFEGMFKQWWRDSNIVLDEASDILQRAMAQLQAEAELTKQTEQCTLNLDYDQTLWTSFNTGFSEGVSLLHVVSTGGSLRLSATKVLRLLQAERVSFTFISLDYLLQKQQLLIGDWQEGYKDCLVIVSNNDNVERTGQLANLSNNINNVLERKSNKKAVLVSQQSCHLAVRLKEGKTRYITICDKFELSDLDQKSQDKLVCKEMLFQNRKIALRSLYHGDDNFWKTLLQDNLVEIIVSEAPMSIGTKLPDVIQHYIPRRLKRANVLNKSVFKPGNFQYPIAVSGVTLEEVKELVGSEENIFLASVWLDSNIRRDKDDRDSNSKNLVLDKVKAAEEFEGLCRLEPTVHWLNMEDGILSWITSNGKLANVKQFIDETQPSIVQSEKVMAFDSRVYLVIAEPGMGKSTLIPSLAQAAKNADLADWVIHINLRDHSELFNQPTALSALDFLTSALHIVSPLERVFLRVSLEQTGNIVVMLDSFDEISPRYEQEGCGLLASILKTRVKKVVVTSRHCMQHMLENHLSTLAYSIVEFSEDDQRMFFRKFWSQSSTPKTPEELEEFISTLVDSVNTIDTEKRLMGIPLQTMMLAEIFNDHVVDPEHNKFPQKLDMINLFEQFVEKKFKIFFSKGYNNLNKEDSMKKFVSDHMHAALKLLVHGTEIHQLKSKLDVIVNCDILLKNIEEAKENAGLVIGVIDKRPIFLHQMFAEYFAGRWFAEHFHSNRDFLREHLFMPNYSIIRIMFDRILSKGHRLHEAVLDVDLVRLETLLTVEHADINGTDFGGRSALHLAAAVGFEFQFSFERRSSEVYEISRTDCPRPRHVVELLIEQKANVNVADSVLMWNPLEYALKTWTWDALEFLLAITSDRTNLRVPRSLLKFNHFLEGVSIYGFANILALLLQHGLSVEFQVEYRRGLLYYASRCGYVESIELLLSKGADKRLQDYDNDVALHVASRFGHLSVVRALIEDTSKTTIPMLFKSKHKSNLLRKYVNITNGSGESALHLAMTSDVCSLLVSHGADLLSRDKAKRTCLHSACSDGRPAVVDTLIASLGSNRDARRKFINTVDANHDSAVALASKNKHADVVRSLVAYGADVTARNVSDGRTGLHWASYNRDLEVLRTLVESFGNNNQTLIEYMNVKDTGGMSSLHHACINGCLDIVRLLIKHGADVMSSDAQGRTCLHSAGSSEVALELIGSLGGDADVVSKYVNMKNNEGFSALDEASKLLEPDRAKLLISHGADVWSCDKCGRTCLHMATSYEVARVIIESLGGDKDVVTKLLNTPNDMGVSPLAIASYSLEPKVVNLLISHGADVWSRDQLGRTCLHMATSYGVARVIIESLGGDKDVVTKLLNTPNDMGISPLAIASYKLEPEVANLLISHGADVWSRDQFGRTCLHMVRSGEVARVLIESMKAEKDVVSKYINSQDNEGVSALALASRYGSHKVVEVLILHGANVWSRDDRGRTSLHAAAEFNYLSVAQALIGRLGDDKAGVVDYINTRDSTGRTAREVAMIHEISGNNMFLDWLDTILRQNTEAAGPLSVPA